MTAKLATSPVNVCVRIQRNEATIGTSEPTNQKPVSPS